MENKTARFTVLLDPRKKRMFEEICAAQISSNIRFLRGSSRTVKRAVLFPIGVPRVNAWSVLQFHYNVNII